MVPFAGWDMPVEYCGIVDELLAVRSRAAMFDVSHMGEITIVPFGMSVGRRPDTMARSDEQRPNGERGISLSTPWFSLRRRRPPPFRSLHLNGRHRPRPG